MISFQPFFRLAPWIFGAVESKIFKVFLLCPAIFPVNKESQGDEQEGGCMAKVIEFYIPERFRKQTKWVPQEQRGKLIDFKPQLSKSA